MDLFNRVRTLEDYKKLTELLLQEGSSNLRVRLNIFTICTLKNLQYLEVQYFNKFNQGGAALLILDRLLHVSWSETMWSVCGNELVLVIQYWLEELKRHLMNKNPHWWKFLSKLLGFIQKLPPEPTIVAALVRQTGACLLELATRNEPSIEQRYLILKRFNDFCKMAQRDVRLEHKDKFDRYFQELARYMSSCGDVCMQMAILEVLLRWTLQRRNPAARQDAAARWLPAALYSREAVKEFVSRDWSIFPTDARSFLKVHNKSNNNVVSILCDRLCVGNITITTSTRERWLDINIGSKRISLMFDKPMYLALKIKEEDRKIAELFITEANTEEVKMYTRANHLIISMRMIDPLQMFPTKALEGKHIVKMLITGKTDVIKVDNALRAIFDKKYTFIGESENMQLTQASEKHDSSRISEFITDEETIFSNPPEVFRRKLLDPKSRNASTATSRSIHENFIAHQVGQLDKVADSAQHQSGSSSKIFAAPLLDPRSYNILPNYEDTKRGKGNTFADERKNLNRELKISLEKDIVIDLLAQEALNELPKSFISTNPENTHMEKDKILADERTNLNREPKISTEKDIIVDLLAQEAFQYSPLDDMNFQRRDVFSTNAEIENITTRQKSENSQRNRLLREETDELNTSFIKNSSTIGINTKFEEEKAEASKDSGFPQPVFDDKTIETFFSQHFYEKKDPILAISPTLARKINDSGTSRESVHLDSNKLNTEEAGLRKPLKEVTNIDDKNKVAPSKKTNTKSLKLTFKKTKQPKVSTTDSLSKKRRKSDKTATNKNEESSKVPEKVSTDEEIYTPLIKRKRKLYSAKDTDLNKAGIRISETEEDTRNSCLIPRENVHANPTTTAIPYKELETICKDRTAQKFFSRKSSSRKEDLFDRLKATVESDPNIVLIDMKNVSKSAVFNYTSSSDEDFRKKKIAAHSDKKTRRPRRKTFIRTRAKTKLQSEGLVDERMRKADAAHLNTSVVQESCDNEIPIEVEPKHIKPKMDILSDYEDSKKATTPAKKSWKWNKKTSYKRKSKQDDDISNDSSLPDLEIETVQAITELDNSLKNVGKLNNNCDNLQELGFTQNLLYESEQVNNSYTFTKVNNKNTASERSQSTSSDKCRKLLVVLDKFDIHQEDKSISTTGTNPIMAHGIHEESPPKIDEINKRISPRSLETEGLSEEARGYYHKLLRNSDSSPDKNRRSKSREKQKMALTKDTIIKRKTIPYVSITRLPRSELRRYLNKSHEVKSADPLQSYLHKRNLHFDSSSVNSGESVSKTKNVTIVGDSTDDEKSTCITRKPIITPITLESKVTPQVHKNAIPKIRNTDDEKSKLRESITTQISLEPSGTQNTQVNENTVSKIGNKEFLASKSSTPRVTLERLKGSHPSTSQAPQDSGLQEHQNIASTINDWFQRNKNAKRRAEEDINEMADIMINKIETWKEIQHNTKALYIKLLVNLVSEREKLKSEREQQLRQTYTDTVHHLDEEFTQLKNTLVQQEEAFNAEFMSQARDTLRRNDRETAELLRQLIEEIQALKHTAHDDNDDCV